MKTLFKSIDSTIWLRGTNASNIAACYRVTNV